MMMEGIPFRMTRASLLKQKMKTQGGHFYSLRYYKNRHTHKKKKNQHQQLIFNSSWTTPDLVSVFCVPKALIFQWYDPASLVNGMSWNALVLLLYRLLFLSSTIMEPLLCICGAQDWSLPQCCSQLSKPQSCKCKHRLLRQNTVAQEQSNCLWSPRNRIIPKLNHFQALTELMKMRRSELFKVKRSTIWS